MKSALAVLLLTATALCQMPLNAKTISISKKSKYIAQLPVLRDPSTTRFLITAESPVTAVLLTREMAHEMSSVNQYIGRDCIVRDSTSFELSCPTQYSILVIVNTNQREKDNKVRVLMLGNR